MSFVKVSEKELTRLRKKARAHDVYLAACKIMAERQYAHLTPAGGPWEMYRKGWLACLREFSEAVVVAEIEPELVYD